MKAKCPVMKDQVLLKLVSAGVMLSGKKYCAEFKTPGTHCKHHAEDV